jgi:hypothetical protein
MVFFSSPPRPEHRASELAGRFEHGNVPCGVIQGREFFDHLSDY